MKKRKSRSFRKLLDKNVLPNVVLGILVLSVGTLCLAPMDSSLQTDAMQSNVYRNGNAKSGVSLLINVYWGTEEVYRMLEVLEEYDAKATFFIGGCWADDNVDCLRAIFADGHEIGNHGYFHKDHTKLSLVDNQKEISSCNRFIELAIGVKPTLFAPPSGSYNNVMLSACKGLRMKTILWTKDTIDWRDKDKTLVYTRATKNIKAGDFVLMHPMSHTVEALPDILSYYQSVGLQVLTVSQHLQFE